MIAKKLAMCAAGLGIGAVCAVGAPAPAHATTMGDELIKQVNEYRASLGLAPVHKDANVQKFSEGWAHHTALQDKRNGLSEDDHSTGSGYAEIMSYSEGYADVPSAAVDGWKHSPDHNAIMTDGKYTRVGADCAQGRSGAHYCVMNFDW